jgi:hypothetical protein
MEHYKIDWLILYRERIADEMHKYTLPAKYKIF